MAVTRLCFVEDQIDEVYWGLGTDRSNDTLGLVLNLACNHFRCDAVSFPRWNFVAEEVLVLRLAKLVLRVQVDPQLEPDTSFRIAGWHLRVHDTFPRRHPLDIAWAQLPFVPSKIFVLDLSIQHVGDCLEASVWVVRKPTRQLEIE